MPNRFQADYEKSRQKEIEFETFLKNNYRLLTENSSTKGYFPFWDVSTTAQSKNNKVTTFEVKYNSEYSTGNVVIEACRIIDEIRISCGLSLTQADYYVLCFENDSNWYFIKTEKLKELVEQSKGHKNNKTVVKDDNGYLLHIFNKEYLLSFCKAY